MSHDDYNCRCGPKDTSNAAAIGDGQRLDEVLTALSDVRRRYILYYLQDNEQAPLADIAQQVVAWEHECPIDDVSEESIVEFKSMLSHHHLPKLQEADIVEYDARSKMVVFRAPPDLVEICLKYCEPHDLPG